MDFPSIFAEVRVILNLLVLALEHDFKSFNCEAMFGPQIRGRAALPVDERPVRNCSSKSIVGITKYLPQNDVVTWPMDRTSTRTISSAHSFLSI